MNKLNQTLSALLLGATFQVQAAGTLPLPAEMPKQGPEKASPAAQIIKRTLANGLEVWVLPRQGLPRVDFVLALRGAGYGADPVSQPGGAKLLARLLSEATTQRNAKAIAEAAQGMGGSVAATAGHDGMTIAASALASHAPEMVQLLAEVALQPAFADDEVALTKSNAMQSLRASRRQPGVRADLALDAAIYGDHPYGRTQATEASIQALTPAWLRTAHAERFRPDRALLVITGRINAPTALKLAQHHFGEWKAEGAPLPEMSATRTEARPQRILLESPGSVQATLRLGRPGQAASGEDQMALRFASTLMGGSSSSRLRMNLRESKAYTYDVSVAASSYRLGGAVRGGADVRNAVTGSAIEEFVREFRRLGEEPVDPEEMALNQRLIAGSYLLTNQMQAALAQTLSANWLRGLPPEFLSQYVTKIQQVTPEQVQAIGKKYFTPEEQIWVVVGDKAQIAEQLKAFGEFKTPPQSFTK